MAYDHAPRILKDKLALIAQSAEGIYDDNLVIIFWENVEPARINECIKYLNDDTNSVVTGPVTYDDILFADDLFHLHAYYSEQEQRIYRIMMREPISALADSDFTTAIGTKWKLIQGQTYAQGQSTVVIGMQNVTAEAALLFQLEGLDEFYTSIHLLTGIEMTGAWYNMNRQIQINNSTGLYTVLWELNSFAGSEVGFIFKDTFGSVTTEVNVIEANEDIIQDFLANNYFDSAGNWYLSTDGIVYTRKNGVDQPTATDIVATGAGAPVCDGTYIPVTPDGANLLQWSNGTVDMYKTSSQSWLMTDISGGAVYYTGGQDSTEDPTTLTWTKAVYTGPDPGPTLSRALVLPSDAVLLGAEKSGRSVRARSFYDEREKNWNVQFIVRNIDNENDYIFNFNRSSQEVEALFFKLNMPSADIDAFLENYYFDEDGNYYLTDDAGVNYIEKNGAPTATTTMPIDAENLRTVVSGRIADVNVSPDDQMDTVSVRVRLVWGSDIDESGFIYQAQNDTIATEVELVAVSETRRDAFLENTYTDSDGNWYYAESLPLYTSKNGDSSVTGNFTTEEITAVKLDAPQEGRSLRVQTSYIESKDRWNLRLSFQYGDSELRLSQLGTDAEDDISIKPTPDTVLTIDKGFNLTRAQVTTIEAYYNATCPAGTTRRVEVNPRPNGYFDYDAIEIETDSVTAKFVTGNKTTYFGFHHPKKPTTDESLGDWTVDANGDVVNDAHILLGASTVYNPGSPEIPPTSGGDIIIYDWPVNIDEAYVAVFSATPDGTDANGRPYYTGVGEERLECKDWGDGYLRWGFRNRFTDAEITTIDVNGTNRDIKFAATYLHDSAYALGDTTSQLTVPTEGWRTEPETYPTTFEDGFLFSDYEPYGAGYGDLLWLIQGNFASDGIGESFWITQSGGSPLIPAVPPSYTISSTEISSTVDVSNSIRYEEDGTWSWNVEIESIPTTKNYTGTTGSALAVYGAPDEEWRWLGRYEAKAIGNTISLAGTYGTNGRTVIIKELRNERIDEHGKISYDVYQRKLIAPQNTNDAWFFMGCTESTDREKRTITSAIIDVDGNTYGTEATHKNTLFGQLIDGSDYGVNATPGGDSSGAGEGTLDLV